LLDGFDRPRRSDQVRGSEGRPAVGHAAWDVHFRADRVVPRWWSEWCLVLDTLLAVVLVVRV
jgi:hypothetical protein